MTELTTRQERVAKRLKKLDVSTDSGLFLKIMEFVEYPQKERWNLTELMLTFLIGTSGNGSENYIQAKNHHLIIALREKFSDRFIMNHSNTRDNQSHSGLKRKISDKELELAALRLELASKEDENDG